MIKKRILLINPPRYEVWPENFDDMGIWIENMTAFFPVALLRMASYFRDQGHDVSLINCAGDIKYDEAAERHQIGKRRVGNFKDKEIFSPLFHIGTPFEEIRQKLKQQEKPDEIYVTSFFTYQWESVHEVIKICRETFPSAKITMGGIYPTLCPDHAKTSGAELYIGELNATNHSRLALDLLEPPPNYMILKISRGCPSKCSYCAVHVLEGNAMRWRDPEDAVDEIQENIDKYQIKKVAMWESSILVNPKEHFERFLNLIIIRKIKINLSFPEGVNPNLLSEALLVKMKMAGVNRLSLSVETNNRETAVKRFHSVHKLPAFQRIMKSIKKAGILANAFILAGMPNQNVKDVKDTVLDVLNAGCRPELMPFTPIPGTTEYMNCREDIAHKGLENLHPWLWPCVNSYEDYAQLSDLHKKCKVLMNN
ncbi:MAG: radical SAM protein [Candidatus Omnitrophica bacterium]|nr:radical SAM protein [Candidatus Omnitrophota bacterium]MDE2221580.1 radical SAM protein [Candidatus Omnitrophota bacterium]